MPVCGHTVLREILAIHEFIFQCDEVIDRDNEFIQISHEVTFTFVL
jgi:hypothetical protein